MIEKNRDGLHEPRFGGVVERGRPPAVRLLYGRALVIDPRTVTEKSCHVFRIVFSTLISGARDLDPSSRSVDARSGVREHRRKLRMQHPTPWAGCRCVSAKVKELGDDGDVLALHRQSERALAAAKGLVRLRRAGKEPAQCFDVAASHGMMNRRDLEGVDRRVTCLGRRWCTGQTLAESFQITEERVREDVPLGPMAEQNSLNFAAVLHADGAKRCDEDEGLDRRRLVHVDSIVEQEVDDMPASSQHREPQELRGVRCRGENVRRTRQELAKRRCVAAAGQVEGIDGRRVAQARSVRGRSQRRARLTLVNERSRQLANLLVDHASCRYVGDRDLERGTKMREPFACQRARDRQKIVAMLKWKMSDAAVLSVTAKPLAEEAFLRLALAREVAPEERRSRASVSMRS